MTPVELRDAERLVDSWFRSWSDGARAATSSTRMGAGSRHGRCSVATSRPGARSRAGSGGGPSSASTAGRHLRHPGSMERHSRLLLRFVQALSAASAVKTESFVFGTRLTRVTRLLRDRDRDRARRRWRILSPTGPAAPGSANPFTSSTKWPGGRSDERRGDRGLRRLGPGRPGAGRRGERPPPSQLPPAHLAQPAGRHRRLPAAGRGDACGAFPHIDDFLAAGTVASLERLGEVLGGARAADVRWRWRGRGPCLAGPAFAAARERLRPDHHRHARRSAGRAEDHPASADPRRIRVRACDSLDEALDLLARHGARRRSSPAGRACSR